MILKKLQVLSVVLFLAIAFLPVRASAAVGPSVGDDCDPKEFSYSFLSLPTWYEYLPGRRIDEKRIVNDPAGGPPLTINKCVVTFKEDATGSVKAGIPAIWLIGLALIEILLRLVGVIAFGIVIFAGFKYITSQGNADATKAARQTIINAFIGIVITIIASVSVSFAVRLLQK